MNQAAPWDHLIEGATVLTADEAQPVLRGAFIGVHGGRIVWLSEQRPTHPARQHHRMPGHVITPGFVNTHMHAILTMVRGVAADLGFAPSYTPGIPKGTQVTPPQARALARLGALEALLFGSTVVADHFVHADISTEAMVELGLRLCPSWRIHDIDFDKVAQGVVHHDPHIGERTLQAGLALRERWLGHPRVQVNLAAHAVDTCSNDFLREIAHHAQAHDMVVSMHVGQSQLEVERVRERTGHSSVEVLQEVGLLNPRLMAGHCIYVSDSDVAALASHGAHVVHIPKCNAASGRLAPTHKLKQAGINIALATDTQHGDMVELMRWALATARVQTGRVDADWQPSHVFAMATLNGARALGMDEDIGSLRVGKKADLVVFDATRPHWHPQVNPLGTLVHTGQGRDVRMVMVDGAIVVQDGLPTQVDMQEVMHEAQQALQALWSA